VEDCDGEAEPSLWDRCAGRAARCF